MTFPRPVWGRLRPTTTATLLLCLYNEYCNNHAIFFNILLDIYIYIYSSKNKQTRIMYWLSALPLSGDSPENVWIALQKATHRYGYSDNYAFKIPDTLKVGTLDSLLSLSDDLIKVNSAVEGTVNKIRRQLYEVETDLPEEDRHSVTVEGSNPEIYIQSFMWDEAKYPSRRPPKDTVSAIMETVQKLDDDLKARGGLVGC